MTRPVIDNFTWDSYRNLLELVRESGYTFASYDNHEQYESPCIVRHDIDASLERAVDMARFEARCVPDLQATYFVLVSGNWYNIHSKKSRRCLQMIQEYGHAIGLHFDDTQYENDDNPDAFCANVTRELTLLQEAANATVTSISMHRPRPEFLDSDFQFPNLHNTYSDVFYNQFKYLSDSAMRWREDAYKVITSGHYPQLQILTHPIWYGEDQKEVRDRLAHILEQGRHERYELMDETFNQLHFLIQEIRSHENAPA